MWLNRIISFCTGYLEILVRGPHLEKLVNLLTDSGLYLWDVKRLGPEVIHAKMRCHGFLRIRPLLKKSGSVVRIHRRKGWPFIKARLLKRKMFILGAVMAVALIGYLSTFVLVIKVDGFQGAEKERLLAILNTAGLKPGRPKKELLSEKKYIERRAIMKTPNAVWLGINIRGVVAEVRVVKRKTTPGELRSCDLIAARDGVITKIAVIRGVPAVKEGDTVARGDLLISGIQWGTNPETGAPEKHQLVASGIVEARVWYDLEATEPKIVWKHIPKRGKIVHYKLRWGQRLLPLLSFGAKPSGAYTWSRERKRVFKGRNPQWTVEFIKDIWQEANWQPVTRSPRELKEAAFKEILDKSRTLNLTGQPEKTAVWIDEGSFIKLMVTYETIQDIAEIAAEERSNSPY